jgi:hypothetical protein
VQEQYKDSLIRYDEGHEEWLVFTDGGIRFRTPKLRLAKGYVDLILAGKSQLEVLNILKKCN